MKNLEKLIFYLLISIQKNNCIPVKLRRLLLIATQTHQFGSQEKRAGNCYEIDVVIGDGSWIGMGAKILFGVTISRGCVVCGAQLL